LLPLFVAKMRCRKLSIKNNLRQLFAPKQQKRPSRSLGTTTSLGRKQIDTIPRMGILAALVSAVFSTAKDIVSKKLTVHIDGTASAFASFAFALPFYLVVLVVLCLLGHNIFVFSEAFWLLVLARALTDVFAEWLKMYAFSHGDLSLVNILFSLSPLILLALSPWLTNDHLSLSGSVAVVVVVGGSVLLVYRPTHPDWSKQRKVLLLALGATFFFTLNSVFDREAMVQHKPELGAAVVAGFTMTLASAVLLLPFVVLHRQRLAGMYVSRRGLLVRGFLETAFMVAKLLAMQWLAAVYVVGLQRTSLLMSILAGRFIFKEGDFGRRLLAGLLVLAGAAWIAWDSTQNK
jgi:drug/metabolite transporter (DMT)-like permease